MTAGDLIQRVTRLGIGALAVLVLATLLGAAMGIQPPAAAAAEPPAATAHIATVDTVGHLPARNVKMGCPGPDALCDLGGDAVDCAKDPGGGLVRPDPNPPYRTLLRTQALRDLEAEVIQEAIDRPDGVMHGRERVWGQRLHD